MNHLITSHLHTTFLNAYPDGIAVLKPAPEHTTQLVSLAENLAHILTLCPSDSPIPNSCPPNLPRCRPCSETNPLPVIFPASLENSTSIFTIATVPHPLTFISLTTWREQTALTPSLIRRDTLRDAWLNETTGTLLDNKLGGPQRLPLFKEAVANPADGGIASRSLWLIAESQERAGLEWQFGFPLLQAHGQEKDTTTNSMYSKPTNPAKGATRVQSDAAREQSLLQASASILADNANFQKGSSSTADGRRRDLVEAWNMADAEAWRFVRAYTARLTAEREKWEKEERQFAGSVKVR